MNAAVKIEIDKAVCAIKNSIQTQKIYLFGSHAAESATQDSDIDLCVIASLQGMRKIEALRKMRRAMMNEVNSPIDLLVYDNADFAARSALPTTLEYKIVSSGRVLYG
ncbi:MAG: nucleotidyltransferase domain-containing protein [Veillonellaceae bacterium]|nr:nucleotidyltransferase domain-containing protein [Veillonellaceae bacterium]